MPTARGTTTRPFRASMAGSCADANAIVRLWYDCSEPFAATIAVSAVDMPLRQWHFARELLAGGLNGACGLGAVVVARAPEDDDLLIGLHHDDDFLVLRVARRRVARFLHRTYRLVPPGRERDHFDVDALIEQLIPQ